MNENKTNINWLISIYPTLSKKGNARFKILHFFIKRIKIIKNVKNIISNKVWYFQPTLYLVFIENMFVFYKISSII